MPSPLHALPIVAALLVALSGCDAPRATVAAGGIGAPPLPPAAAPGTSAPAPAPPPAFADGATLTVAQVVALALSHDPRAALNRANQRLALAHVTEARAWNDPEAEIELGRATTRDAEVRAVGRVSIRQRMEWPGKRSARIDAAEAGGAVAESTRLLARLAVAGEACATALDVAVDQQGLAQTRAGQALAQEVVAAVERRVAAGEAGRAELLRAKVDALQAEQTVVGVADDLNAARALLVSICGDGLPTAYAIAPLTDRDLPPTLEDALMTAAQHHPDVLRLDTLLRQQQREVERERAAAYPDLTVGVFAGRESDSRILGMSLGIAVPVWNRNRGEIAVAEAEHERLAAELGVKTLNLRREVEAAWRAHDRAGAQAARAAGTVRPASQEALRLALGSYQAGETSLLDLLDARRTAQAIDAASLDAQRQAHATRLRLVLAIGTLPGTAP